MMEGRPPQPTPTHLPIIRGASDRSDRYTTPEDLISKGRRFTQAELEALAGPRSGRRATYGDLRDMLLVDNNPLLKPTLLRSRGTHVPDFPPPNLRNLTSQVVQVGRN